MLFTKTVAALLINLAVANAKCGTADACVGTESCRTTVVSSTTTAYCAPTPTCIGVYGDCTTGGGPNWNCCSGVCAATKCRPTDDRWPGGCVEDYGLCKSNDDCCYPNRLSCVDGLCRPFK